MTVGDEIYVRCWWRHLTFVHIKCLLKPRAILLAPYSVLPAQAGISSISVRSILHEAPAFAGDTHFDLSH